MLSKCQAPHPLSAMTLEYLPNRQFLGVLTSLPYSLGARGISLIELEVGFPIETPQVKADRDRGIIFGETEIDLTYVEQLVESSQTR